MTTTASSGRKLLRSHRKKKNQRGKNPDILSQNKAARTEREDNNDNDNDRAIM